VKYVLMFVETEEFAREPAEMNQAQRQGARKAVGRWLGFP
jgi:hypothetical protein